jgi:NADH dehydrogenase
MVGLDRSKRRIYVQPTHDEDGRQIIPPRALGYDTLVVSVGSVSNDFGIPGAAEHAIALDTAEEAARFNRRMINACLRANAQHEPLRPGQLHCVIVGAGATGVELAAELHKTMRELASFNLDSIDFDKIIRITIIEAGPRVLGALPEHLARSATRILQELDVTIRAGTRVTAVTTDGVALESGEFIAAELIVWAAGIKAPDFLADLDGLETDRINRLVVGDTLQTTRDDNIFAIGDCASCTLPGADMPLPPRAQTAHQQASLMVKSIKARLTGKPVPRFRYRDFGSLVSLSEYRTLGHIVGGLKIEGAVARLMYRSLHKLHQRALHGTAKLVLDTVGELIARRTEPRIKLH